MRRKLNKYVECKALITRRKYLKEHLTTTSFKLLLLAICLLLVTYAWYVKTNTTDVEGLDTTVRQMFELEVSLDHGSTWQKAAALNINTDFTFYNEVTSDGISFYKAGEKSSSGIPLSFVPATANKDYLEFTILFRSSNTSKIYLETKSTVTPAAGTSTNDLIGSNVVRQSANGIFSRDIIAGAVRIAFIEDDLVNGNFIPRTQTSLVWAPNKNYQISNSNGQYSVSLNSSETQNYNYIKVTNPTTFQESIVPNLREDILASHEECSSYNDPVLTEINNISEYDEENIKAITVRVWVEGNDRETVTALKGGLFNITLSFVGLK